MIADCAFAGLLAIVALLVLRAAGADLVRALARRARRARCRHIWMEFFQDVGRFPARLVRECPLCERVEVARVRITVDTPRTQSAQYSWPGVTVDKSDLI